MTEPTGKRRRTTAERPVSPRSDGPDPVLTSHEIASILDAASSQERDPAGRASHPRFDELEHPSEAPLLGRIGSLADRS